MKDAKEVARPIPLPGKFDGDLAVVFANEIPRDIERLLQPIQDSRGFSPNNPCGTGDRERSLRTEVPHELRLASTFIDLLGRNWQEADEIVAWDERDQGVWGYLPGLHNIELKKPLHSLDDKMLITISHETVENGVKLRPSAPAVKERTQGAAFEGRRLLDKLLSTKELNRSFGPKTGLGEVGGRDPFTIADLYGRKEFTIEVGEIKKLERSARIRLGRHLPSEFYKQMVDIIGCRRLNIGSATEYQIWGPKTNVQYYRQLLNVPFSQIVDAEPPEAYSGCKLQDLLRRAKRNPYKVGFNSKTEFDEMMLMSLEELSSEVCISQEGYFLVDKDNQIAPKPSRPIHFVSACAVDFAGESGKVERDKYFTEDGSGFNEGGEERLKLRMRETYDNIFTSCKSMGITYPSFLAMGLGMFLPKGDQFQTLRDLISRAYHEVQFELLQEKDYDFKAFFLNPALAKGICLDLLESGYTFKFPIIIHSKDVKSLTVNLASDGFDTSYLVASGAATMLQTCMANQWEYACAEYYCGEEDVGSTSTILLAHGGISNVYCDVSRMVYIADDTRSMTMSNGTMLGLPPEETHIEPNLDKWAAENRLSELFDSLASTILKYQPADVYEHILRWALDEMLKLHTENAGHSNRASRKSHRPKAGSRESQKTINQDNALQLRLFLRQMQRHFDRELELNLMDKKLRFSKNQKQSSQEDGAEGTEHTGLAAFKNLCKERSVSIQKFNETYDIPLIWCLEQDYPAVASLLLEHVQANESAEVVNKMINVRWLDQNTPLHIAILNKHSDVAIQLIKAGAKSIPNDAQEVPLHLSIQRGLKKVSIELIKSSTLVDDESEDFKDRHIDINVRDENGDAPIHVALRKEQKEIVRALLQNPQCDVNAQDHDSNTPLHYVLRTKQHDLIDLLWQKQRHRVNMQLLTVSNDSGLDCIHYALLNGFVNEAREMISESKIEDIANKIDKNGNTYLHWAFKEEQPEIVKFLIRKGFSLTKMNHSGLFPRDYISKFDRIYLADFLKEKKFDIDQEENTTQLHLQGIHGNLPGLKRLVEFEGEVDKINARTKGLQALQGVTPLQCALHHNHPHVVRYLLSQRALSGWDNIVREIERYGAEVLKKGLAAVLVSDDKRREDRERKLAYNARAQAEIKELKQHSIPKTLRDMDKSAIRRAKLRDEGANTGSRMDMGINGLVNCLSTDKPVELYEYNYCPEETPEEFLRAAIKGPNPILHMTEKTLDKVLNEAKLFASLRVQKKSQPPRHGHDGGKEATSKMGEHEILALYIFTYESPIYREVNSCLMANDPYKIQQWKPYIWYLIQAMQLLPPYRDLVVRGITVRVEEQVWNDMYKIGNVVTWYNFCSSSSDSLVAQAFLGDTSNPVAVFIIKSKTGRNISSYSYYPDEEEVLFEPRSKFLVKNVLSVDTAKLLNLSTKIVELEQIIEEDAFNKTSK
jgi:ankyrin repeat protein|eukprot:CAMPEP_0174359536 /NCGR_PEP_ID=MMETSP0811_2-20130205/49225_1 /TAXON_ID=73025 ORGANISM="Eutreptiella gymnastica-like, Strain CCMP1594" /NCGR_SAMPLE_ID=MMETSP0811_2 /ASSEMBLY_ACC=CAM_ASM_000667 /LENGTH=1443 /DNA_ID=CAMNT_0015494345 /DNA_START=63 /DNA_END=4394 /DNA_ORIENTATION=+